MPSSSRSRDDRSGPSSSRLDRDASDHKRRHLADAEDSHHRHSRDRDRSPDRRKRHRDDDDSRRSHSSRSHRDDHRRDRSDREHRHRDRDADGDHTSSRRSRHDDRDREHRSDRSSKRRETSEERRARKAAKRSEKLRQLEESFLDEEQGAAERTAVAELMMYSAEDNPFNDANLGQKFKWGKKEDRERKQGLSREEAEKRNAQRRQEAMAEIEKLNAKRAEREKQAALREEEEARMARLAESAQMASWVAKEDDFHLEQAQRRAVIRVKENRAKPIDLLSINLKWADPNIIAEQESKQDDDDDEAGLEIDLDEPYTIFEEITFEETEELHQDIQMYLELEKNDSHLDFWRSMLIVCDDKLEELKEEKDAATAAANVRQDPEERGRINSMLSSKSTDELQQLQDQVRAKLASDEPVDVEYWERVFKSIVVWRAKARLRDMHEAVLSNRLEYLRRKQRDEAARQQHELLLQTGDDSDAEDGPQDAVDDQDAPDAETKREVALLEALYDPEEMEPAPIDAAHLSYEDRKLPIKTLREHLAEVVDARRRVTAQLFIPKTRHTEHDASGGSDNPAERMFMQEASKALDVTEEVMQGGDEVLSHQTYQWEDKYRPRKPRFFNRVHTGFDWNKYNQTHYDSDNPPPKTVQGYKFNIFYPDLIDKTVAPTYKVVKEKGEEDTVLLRFSAGPPYEDIAFRIVNREWEYSHKRGFRNSFDRGVLQLHFNFKRLRYRK
ncbi:related to cactin [Sporisorium reilianum f. sp. reilianum]|uniref:Splicing factor Cactin n=1 Tax=Sporisorium reilianum f. sp. reilianum TaxID=72559 RepID=A0A2N8UA95_9BASI|nr:related to cactin [Sporisorium reilianum f. sp. reilianum]